MTAADSPIPGGSRAVADRRVILTDRRRSATRVYISRIACGGEWSPSTRPLSVGLRSACAHTGSQLQRYRLAFGDTDI